MTTPHAHYPPLPVRVAGYIRVSTAEQADSGLSLEAQASKIRALCALHGWPSPRIISDTATAKNTNRPGLAALLSDVAAGRVTHIVIVNLARITRSTRDLADILDHLQHHNVALIAVGESLDTTSAAGRLVVNILGSVAQWEREAISERTRDALATLRTSGRRAGQIPFGYRLPTPDDLDPHTGLPLTDNPTTATTLIPSESEHDIARHARFLHAQGLGPAAIARALNASNTPTRSGTLWQRQYIPGILAAATTLFSQPHHQTEQTIGQ